MHQVERMERVSHNGNTADRTYLKLMFFLP